MKSPFNSPFCISAENPGRAGRKHPASLRGLPEGVVGFLVLVSTHCVSAATFTVVNTNNTGPGSLRQAMLDANVTPGTNSIVFGITNATTTIVTTNTLPDITNPVVMDATTQPGYAGLPIVELTGLNVAGSLDGLRIRTSNSVIRGLVINRFAGDGIEVTNSSGVAIEGNFIGLSLAGTVDQGNSREGILLTNSANCIIGGIFATQRNFISGSQFNGVSINGPNATNNLVIGNVIGLSLTNGAVANSQNGVLLSGSRFNVVGGTTAAERNIISANSSDGVEVTGVTTLSNVIQGNFIGPDMAGTLDRRNSANGVYLNGAPNNIIGGASPGAGNLISRNQSDGVEISGLTASNNFVLGNWIGLDATGTTNLGNFGHGVFFTSNARFNFIGATNSGAGNRIAFNSQDGIYVQSGTNNAIRGNNIWSNNALGLDLDNDGITANDAGDPDTGANFRQNFPTITNAVLSVGNTLIQGTNNSLPSTTFFLDFFASFTRDATTTNGEGQVYLGSTTVTTGADSNAAFSVNLPLTATGGRWITATATDTNGNTSEFSTAFLAMSLLPAASYTVINTNDAGAGSLREAINANNLTFNGAPNTIAFAIPGVGPHLISPATLLPSLTEPCVVDGYTQTNASVNTLSNGENAVIQVRLDGNSSLATGLKVASSNCTVRGMSITRFTQAEIEIAAPGRCAVEGCFLGLDADGVTMFPGFFSYGVLVSGTVGNRIGGDTPAQRNVISGMGSGYGVYLNGAGAMNNQILGNFIGTDRNATTAKPNNHGVYLQEARTNIIGGTAPGARNVISGNTADGINCSFTSPTGNQIWGNFIGTDATGLAPLPNGQSGVRLSGSVGGNNNVGGLGAGEPNVIAYNGGAGIVIVGLTNNALRANSIHDNGSQGIDLGSGGSIAFNDIGDGDGGANFTQNFPTLTNGLATTTNTTLQGFLNSGTNRAYHLDFYANLVCETFGYGEGRKYLGATSVTTDGNGNTSFNVTLPAVVEGRYVTATATDTNGNTSEFSACFPVPVTFAPTTFTVVNTNDSGPGSFREVINTNNITPSATRNVIQFAIPGAGPHVIRPVTPLPAIIEPTRVDGYTQSGAAPNSASNGFNANLQIRLDPNGVFDGLTLASDGNIIRGLAFTRCSFGIAISSAQNVVEGCVFGLTETNGTLGNFTAGLRLVSGTGNLIGGPTPAARNVISANTYGVFLEALASNNLVQGNFIGTDFSGNSGRPNTQLGLYVLGSGNQIGGLTPGAGNLIAANGNYGIQFAGGVSNRVEGNRIGLSATGQALGNNIGIYISSSSSTVIGGADAGARNIISGNGTGIVLASPGNSVLGNYLGTDATGQAARPNSIGVSIASFSSLNRIGGTAPGAGNLIAFNTAQGVSVSGIETTNCPIRGNTIFGNGALGIDLGTDGASTNDLTDADSGANQLQNYPILTAATIHTNRTDITGVLDSLPNTQFTIEFFASVAADFSGFGEGQQFLGSTNVTTGGGGNINFNLTLPVRAVGRFITATATDPEGNTSEFSPAFTAASTWPPIALVVTTPVDFGPGSLRQVLQDAALNPASSNNTVQFAIPGPGPHWLTIFSPLPPPAEPLNIDGFTQPGSSPNTSTNADNAVRQIILDGSQAGAGTSGFQFTQPGNVIRGLIISDFNSFFGGANGIELFSASNVVEGCFITGNNGSGVVVSNAPGNRVGGVLPAQRNTISGHNGRGVWITGSGAAGNLVQNNFIGPAPDGTSAFTNVAGGVWINSAPFNVIGGGEAARNYIAGSGGSGVEISGAGAVSNAVQGNFIGVLPNGAGMANGGAGVFLGTGASNNIVGEPRQSGMGLLAWHATFEQTLTGLRNLIAFNGADGVTVSNGANNTVSANRIFENGQQGIDLIPDGVTGNDTGDGDTGANLRQNFPLLTNVTMTASNVTISGMLNSGTNLQYQLDFYANLDRDSVTNGEGRNFLGRSFVTTDGNGNAAFITNFATAPLGQFVSATATDPAGNTSEFGPSIKAAGTQPGLTMLVTNTADDGPGTLRAAILAVNLFVGTNADNLVFSFANGFHRISLESPLPPIIGDVNIYPANANILVVIDGLKLKSPEAIARYGTPPLLELRDGTHQVAGTPPAGAPPGPFGASGWNGGNGNYFLTLDGGAGDGMRVHNGLNGCFNDIQFGWARAGYGLTGNGLNFTGNSTGNYVNECRFRDILGDGISDFGTLTLGKLKVSGCNFFDIGQLPIRRKFGALNAGFLFSAVCDGASGTDLTLGANGPANKSARVEVNGRYTPYTEQCQEGGWFVDAYVGAYNGFGSLDLQVKAPLLVRDYSYSFTLTVDDNDTSPFSGGTCATGDCGTAPAAPVSVANTANAGEAEHPISTLTGELYELFAPDLFLGGPLPLRFQRYYAAFLARDGRIAGRLGTNWLHNFEMKLTATSNTVEIATALGRVINFALATNGGWTLTGRVDVPYQLASTASNYTLGDPMSQRFFTFSTNGQLTAISDGRGNTHSLSYSNGMLATVNDALGRMFAFQYNGGGLLTNVTDGLRSVSFTQSNGLLRLVRDALGFVASCNYTSASGGLALMTSLTRPRGNTPYRQTFNATGQVITQTDALSNAVTLTYAGDTTTVTDPTGESRRDRHSDEGDLRSFFDEENREVDLGYNLAGQRTGLYDRMGELTFATVHAPSGQLAAVTNADGTVSVYTYTNRTVNGVMFYDLIRVTHADGSIEQYDYDAGGNVIRYTDRGSNQWHFTFNSRGQLLTATNPTGGAFIFTYDVKGNVATSRDSETGITSYQFDSLGRLTNVVHPDSSTLRLVYDANDRLVSITDPRGFTTALAYDQNGNVTNVTDATGQDMQFAYDAMDRLVRATDRIGHSVGWAFDSRRLLAGTTNRNGVTTTFDYDDRRRLASHTVDGSQTWSFGYDQERLLTSLSDPQGRATSYEFDPLGYVSSVADALGHAVRFYRDALQRVTNVVDALGRSFEYEFDARGRLKEATEPGVGSTAFAYNALGLLTQLTDLNGGIWRFEYTPMGRLKSRADPLNRTNRYAYDMRGRLARIEFPDGASVTNTFDASGNLLRRQFSDGTDLRYAYDALNRLTNVVGSDPVDFSWDAEGRFDWELTAGFSWSATHDPGGRLTSVSYNNNAFTVNYGYDDLDRLTSVQDTLTGTLITFGYDPANRLSLVNRPNNVDTRHYYDDAGRVTQTTEGDFPYLLDTMHDYNAVNDPIRTSFSGLLNPQDFVTPDLDTFTYDPAHQISNPGYGYDLCGRLTMAPGRTYTYDDNSRLKSAGVWSFGYDGIGDMVSCTYGGQTMRYFHHGALGQRPIVAERNQDTGQFVNFFIWSPAGTLLYSIDPTQGNAVHHYHFDREGSTIALTDAAGVVTDTYAWGPFGQQLAHTGNSTQPFTYLGQYGVYSPAGSGISRTGNQWYDTSTARFLVPDPYWVQRGFNRAANLYQSGQLNPFHYTSPQNSSLQKIDAPVFTFLDPGVISDAIAESTKIGLDRWMTYALTDKANALVPDLGKSGDYSYIFGQVRQFETATKIADVAGNVAGGVIDFYGEFSQARDEGKGYLASGGRGAANVVAGFALGAASTPFAFVDGATGGNFQHSIMQVYRAPEALFGDARAGRAYEQAIESGKYGVVLEVVHGIGDDAANAAPKFTAQGVGETFNAFGYAFLDVVGLDDWWFGTGTPPPPAPMPPPARPNPAAQQEAHNK